MCVFGAACVLPEPCARCAAAASAASAARAAQDHARARDVRGHAQARRDLVQVKRPARACGPAPPCLCGPPPLPAATALQVPEGMDAALARGRAGQGGC